MQYQAYGLVLDSEFALPELYPAEGTADVCIRFGKVEQRPQDLDADGNAFWCDGEGRSACHYRQGTGWVSVTGGSTIVVEPEDNRDPALLRLAILGPGMALALMQRGFFTFHASAVAISGSGVAFLGRHAAGKSTMAATLHTRGHALVTDDVTVLNDIDGDIHVVPSFPQVKLWANAAENLGLEAGTMPRVHPDFDKYAWRPESGWASIPIPLHRLYVLGCGDQVRVEPIPPHDASKFVMRNWYGSRFGLDFFRAQDQGEHFRRCIDITSRVPVMTLLRPEVECFADLAEEIKAAILQDLEQGPD